MSGAVLRFSVLGPVRTWRGRSELLPGAAQRRALLAILVVKAGQAVSMNEIVDVLWDGRPPPSAVNVVHKHVSALRRVLEPDLDGRARSRWLDRVGHGYLLRPNDGAVDLLRFRDLAGAAGDARAAGHLDVALDRYNAAIDLWAGRCAADLDPRVRSQPLFTAIDREFVAAVRSAVDVALAVGRAERLLLAVQRAATWEPLDESVQARLMLVLAANGRQADALAAYTKVRELLADELGVDPSPELRAAQERVLRQDLGSDRAEPVAPAAALSAQTDRPRLRPAQLPPAVADFVGRDAAITRLDGFAAEPVFEQRPGPVVVVIAGGAGVGKTALAVHWARRIVEDFPDGQLYVDLRGYSPGASMSPGEALSRFLRALGTAPERIPPNVDEQAALYRTLLADRTMLIVLDNAETVEQVRPLFPGNPNCLAVVTSRDRLTGLVARDGARRLDVDVLEPGDAYDLLARVVGAERAKAEPDQVAELTRLCARLPLALRIAAANLVNQPHDQVAVIVARLRDADRLAALSVNRDDQTAVRGAFDLSYQALEGDAQRLFRRLGLVPGPDVTPPAAATLVDMSVGAAHRLLDGLVDAHLVESASGHRYVFHDLLRLYAAERSQVEDSPAERANALRRLFDGYLNGVDAAGRLIRPQMIRLPRERAELGSPDWSFSDQAEALAWLEAERPNLMVAIQQASLVGLRPFAWQLADSLRGYFQLRRHQADWLTSGLAGLAAATGHDERAEAAMLLTLAQAEQAQGRIDRAVERLRSALSITRRRRWPLDEAAVLNDLGRLYHLRGQPNDARACLTESVAIEGGREHAGGPAITLVNLGLVVHDMGRLDDALVHFDRAVALSRSAGIRPTQALALGHLGSVYRDLGKAEQARRLLDQAADLAGRVGARLHEAEAFIGLAAVDADLDLPDRAAGHAQRALTFAQVTGVRSSEAHALNTLADISCRTHAFDVAADYAVRALEIARAIGYLRFEPMVCTVLAAAQVGLGRLDDALVHTTHALAIAEACGYRPVECQALIVRADIELRTGRPDAAAASRRTALAIRRDTGYRRGAATTKASQSTESDTV